MEVKKSDNKIPASISSKREIARIAISVDGATPINLEFTPSNSISWMIQNFVFDSELEFQVFGIRGGKIPDSELRIDWISIMGSKDKIKLSFLLFLHFPVIGNVNVPPGNHS